MRNLVLSDRCPSSGLSPPQPTASPRRRENRKLGGSSQQSARVFDDALEFALEGGGKIVALEAIGDIGGEEADLVAAVIGRAVEFQAPEVLPACRRIIASVIWISPPAPGSCFSISAKISGCRI